MIIPPHDPAYPRRLLELEEPPAITVSGPLDERARVVAIVGSREAKEDALNWAHQLAYHLARAGIVVVSGGAVGIDWAAHRGAMKAGATWCVACTGRDARPFPPRHRDLFHAIASSADSRMVWPFPLRQTKTTATPRQRNRVLTALADVIVVIQARIASGSLNAASNADRLGRRLYVVPGRPWDYPFLGSAKLILEGAWPLVSIEQLFTDLDLPSPDLDDPEAVLCGRAPHQPAIRAFKRRAPSYASVSHLGVDPDTLPPDERLVHSSLSMAPTHQDKIVARSGLGASTTLTALLTLSLRDVVVEGPDGFFRLRTEP